MDTSACFLELSWEGQAAISKDIGRWTGRCQRVQEQGEGCWQEGPGAEHSGRGGTAGQSREEAGVLEMPPFPPLPRCSPRWRGFLATLGAGSGDTALAAVPCGLLSCLLLRHPGPLDPPPVPTQPSVPLQSHPTATRTAHL